ncbi:CheR family methyltransferase [Zoogloea sp.]|uniref:CheR family methyltransferase n=1 Tax=Zoogloea sp. TaxID=49181 RepID=UPI002639F4F1|nr:CheR family methyltransferase [Zoogloea sp.]MDD3354051.1 chemotaxis protein CheR [Zoogloea sp.]
MSDKPTTRHPVNPLGLPPLAARKPHETRPAAVSPSLSAAGLSRNTTTISPEREFAFSGADFERVRELIHKHAGISLSPIKQDMVYSRLARRLRARGDKTFAEYLDRAQREPEEWETFVNSLTTNLTSFFREAHHFEILAERLKRHATRSPFRIWCSAASTGEEPYSLAITACEAFNTLSPPVQILATDIDTNVLATASRGVYGMDRVERLSRERMQKFFLKGTGSQAGHARIRSELQRLIEFKRINLLDNHWAVQGPFDALFCRNVMIYFDKPTQYMILQRFAPLLKPDGALFAGHSESFLHAADLFRSMGRTVYERTDARAR